jgi:hypothetical protein
LSLHVAFDMGVLLIIQDVGSKSDKAQPYHSHDVDRNNATMRDKRTTKIAASAIEVGGPI